MRDITTEIQTESGAVYQFKPGFVRRLSSGPEMRRDGQWIKVFSATPPINGESMIIWLEPLDPEATITRRITTPVVSAKVV